MLKTTDILKGTKEKGKEVYERIFSPIVGRVLEKGFNIPAEKYQPYLSGLYDVVDVASHLYPIIIPPKQNAAFGVGTLGTKDPAPAFVGDRQQLVENRERIETPMTRAYNTRKRNTYNKIVNQNKRVVRKRVPQRPKKGKKKMKFRTVI